MDKTSALKGTALESVHPRPGIPVEVTTEQVAMGLGPIMSRLYALDYTRNNAMRRTLILIPEDTNLDKAVLIAKAYCKKRGWNFSWMELAIVELKET